MATEMPIPQDYNRYVDPMEDDNGELEDVAAVDLFDQETEIEELEDGSVIVRLEDETETPQDDPDFYENLAESLDSYTLTRLATKYIEFAEKDKEAREDRDKQYEEGIKRTGLGNDAPGGAQFMGASKVVHPIMAEACVDFAARAIKELFPADGPVKTKIVGEVTEDKVKKAERKRDFLNWQLTEQMEEYRDEEEQLLTQLPLGGSQYMKIWYDEHQKRPCCEFVPIDNIYLPFASGNFYTSQRVTEVNDITQETFYERVASKLYKDVDIIRVSMEPEESKSEKATNRVEGKKASDMNIDGIRRVYHIYTWLELEDDQHSKGARAPYILMVDDETRDVVGLYRNWEKGDSTMTKLDWLVEFKFIPWRGAYAIGLPHLIGGLSAALTGALRALMDSAHINNAPTMLKLKGAKIGGQTQAIEPTQVAEIEGAPGVDDIKKLAMPLPFNPPSQVLFQLLGWLTGAAKGVVTTAEEKIADITSNAPVGTTQALIEQGAAVFSSIHARLHMSQKRVLQIVARLNRWYLDEEVSAHEMIEELGVTSEDFEKNTDIIPVSDPHIFAESQRYAQIQTLAARAQANPDLYNRLAVEKRILKQIKIPDINEILPDPREVQNMNPALENVAMTLGQPVGAYPEQDHMAHFMTHLNYFKDPLYGSNPVIAPTLVPAMLEHLKQHLTLWYLDQMDGYATQGLGKPFNILKVEPVIAEAQKLLAIASNHVHLDVQQMPVFQEIGQLMTQSLQMIQQMRQQQGPQDPAVQALIQTSMAETQRKTAKDQADIQLKATELQQRDQIEMKKIETDFIKATEKNLTDERIKAAELSKDALEMKQEQLRTVIEAQNQVQSQL